MNTDNRGALWKNDRREKDTHPNLQGQATINGVEYWVNAWTSKEGGNKPLVSMTFKPKQPARQQAASQGAPHSADLEDDIPW